MVRPLLSILLVLATQAAVADQVSPVFSSLPELEFTTLDRVDDTTNVAFPKLEGIANRLALAITDDFDARQDAELGVCDSHKLIAYLSGQNDVSSISVTPNQLSTDQSIVRFELAQVADAQYSAPGGYPASPAEVSEPMAGGLLLVVLAFLCPLLKDAAVMLYRYTHLDSRSSEWDGLLAS